MLNATELVQIEKSIQNKIIEIKVQIQLAQTSSETVELDQTLAGRVSRIDAILQQKMAQSAVVRDTALLARLKQSIKEISNSDYGVCVECDNPIPFQRMLVKPETKLCVMCQQLLE